MSRTLSVSLAICGGLLLACVARGPLPFGYDFFHTPGPDDPWSRKISAWQSRERASAPELDAAEPAPTAPGDLRAAYLRFRAEQKRRTARELADWIQTQARDHYVPDGDVDHWATLAETLERNGDDCDGLELLSYNHLRGLGFAEDEVYRAIVYRPADRQHHMVTLWFEERDDPWVIDPTGAMVAGMPRLSQVPGWVPLKVFSMSEEFTAARKAAAETQVASAR